MEAKFSNKLCLLLSVLLAGAKFGLGQDVPATATFRILETANDLAVEGKLKDALRIVQFVQSTPGLTDQESTECKRLLVRFESLAIKFYASQSADRATAVSQRDEVVGALPARGRMSEINNESSRSTSDAEILESVHEERDRIESGFVKGNQSKFNKFEWMPVDESESRSAAQAAGLYESRISGRPNWMPGTEAPTLLQTTHEVRHATDESDSIYPAPGVAHQSFITTKDPYAFTGAELDSDSVDTGTPSSSLPLTNYERSYFDEESATSATKCRDEETLSEFFRDFVFDLRWGVLITGVLLGSLVPATVSRLAVHMRDRDSRTQSARDGTVDRILDGESQAALRCDSIFSQIIEENQRLKR